MKQRAHPVHFVERCLPTWTKRIIETWADEPARKAAEMVKRADMMTYSRDMRSMSARRERFR